MNVVGTAAGTEEHVRISLLIINARKCQGFIIKGLYAQFYGTLHAKVAMLYL